VAALVRDGGFGVLGTEPTVPLQGAVRLLRVVSPDCVIVPFGRGRLAASRPLRADELQSLTTNSRPFGHAFRRRDAD